MMPKYFIWGYWISFLHWFLSGSPGHRIGTVADRICAPGSPWR